MRISCKHGQENVASRDMTHLNTNLTNQISIFRKKKKLADHLLNYTAIFRTHIYSMEVINSGYWTMDSKAMDGSGWYNSHYHMA